MLPRQRLELFNEKVERLGEGRLVRLLKEQGFAINLELRDDNYTLSRRGPDEDSVQAAILTIRFFVQDNEPCSLRNLAKLYEDPRIPETLRFEFVEFRRILNDYLDGPGKIAFAEGGTTRRQNFYAALYGDLSHSSNEHREHFNRLNASPLSAVSYTSEFMATLIVILKVVFNIAGINRRVIESDCLNDTSDRSLKSQPIYGDRT